MKIDKLNELKIAVKFEQEVVLSLVDGNVITGMPEWNSDLKRVKLKIIEGSIWIPLNKIEHVTRIIPFGK